MKIKKLKIAAAVTVALSCSVAHATTGTWTAIVAPTKIASQRDAAFLERAAGDDTVLTIDTTAADPDVLLVGDKLVITISGAKFNRTGLAAAAAAAVTIDSGTFAAGVWDLDAATDTILTTTALTAASTAATDVVLTVVASEASEILDLTGVANKTDVTFKVEVKRDLVGVETTAHDSAESSSVVAINDFLTAAVATPETGTITVTSSFKELDGTTSTTSATAGDFVTVINDDAPSDATGTGIVTISGNMTGVTEIAQTLSGAGTLTSCDASGTAAAATGGGNLVIDAAASEAYFCIDNTAIKVVQTFDPLFKFDGTTALASREYSIGIDYVEGGSDGISAFSVAEISAITLTRDGSSFSVTASGKKNKIKITDMSGSADAGAISITAYDASGAEITGTYVTPVLEANATVTIDMNDVVPLYTGAVRYDFIVESTEIIASNVKKHDLGVTAETYRNSTTIDSDDVTTKAGSGAL